MRSRDIRDQNLELSEI